MDVAFVDDQMRARTGHSAHNLAVLKYITLNLIRLDPNPRKGGIILPEIISKEPLGPLVRRGDDEWFAIVKWVVYGLIEAEGTMQHAHGQLQILLVNHHRYLDFRCRNHLDIDPFLGQHPKHLAGNAGMRTHADTDRRHLAGLVVTDDAARIQFGLDGFQHPQCLRVVAAIDSE